ncbi:MAG: RNA polymerase factor sigma-54 [Bacteroidales bacterium]|nr:RNA polymerase factor sigma-54 [Bacteroidales bacterium]
MAQIIKTGTSQRHNLQKYLTSTMVQATHDDLEQLINDELQTNVALEIVDPSEAEYNGSERDDSGVFDGDEEEKTNEQETLSPTDEGDTSITDQERGDAVAFDNDDDEPVNTSSNLDPDEEDFNPIDNVTNPDTFRDDLKKQIEVLDISNEEHYLACYIVDCLDENGYLRRPLAELVDDLEMTQHYETTVEDLEAVLVDIIQQELEPSGIGARDLRECMLLQLGERKGHAAQLAYKIVNQKFDDLSNKRYDRIELDLNILTHAELVDALHVIRRLNPKPGNMQPFSAKTDEVKTQQIRPDFIVRNEDGQLVVSLNDDNYTQVRISADQERLFDELQESIEDKTADSGAEKKDAPNMKQEVIAKKREGIKFLRENIHNARVFIAALEQRRNTLIDVMQTIVDMQRAYFFTGQVETLKPMTQKDVADRCNYDISTISRVSNSKYVDTEFGIVRIKDLFTNAVADSNQAAVMEALKNIIDNEDKRHPLTDEALAEELGKQGNKIERRTVSKYRELLGYQVARLRKEV